MNNETKERRLHNQAALKYPLSNEPKALNKLGTSASAQKINPVTKGQRGDRSGIKFMPPQEGRIKVPGKSMYSNSHHIHAQSMNLGPSQKAEDLSEEYPPDALDISDEFENLKLLINEGAGVIPHAAQPGSRTTGVNRENKVHTNNLQTMNSQGKQKRSVTPNRQTRGKQRETQVDTANMRKKSLERGTGRGGGAKPGITDLIRPGSRGKRKDVREIVRAQVLLHNQQL